MALDFEITCGRRETAVKAALYAIEGVGKTTFASRWPGAVFIDTEGGSKLYDVARLPEPRDWNMLVAEADSVSRNPSEVGTLVIDTMDAAEELCVAHVLDKHNKSSMEDWAYQAGWRYVYEEMRRLFAKLDACVAAGVNVLLVAHAQIVKFEQPDEMGAYDRYEMKLHKGKNTNVAALVKEWADLLLFANFKTDVLKDDKGGRAIGSGGTRRVMYAQRRAAWDAKNRYGLPDKMPFDFSEIGPALFGDEAVEPPEKPKTAEDAHAPEKEPKAAQPRKERPETAKEEPVQDAPHILDGAKVTEVTPDNVRKLHRLMERDGVNEAQLAMAVNANPRAKYTDKDRIADYSAKFVDSLVAHWDSVAKKAHEFDPYHEDYIPFS